MDLHLLGLVLFFVLTGAMVKGLTGFGFGILGTALLVNFIDAQTAVTVMILPMLAVNIPLILDTEFSALKSCLKRFKYFIFSGLIGAFSGVLLIDFLPLKLISLSVGVLAVIYVYFKQDLFYRPGSHISKCISVKWYSQIGIGALSGLVFGASNIGLMFVSYLDRLEVDRKTFAGLVSTLIFSATVIRASMSTYTGLFTSELLIISLLASVIGVFGVKIFSQLRSTLPKEHVNSLTLSLILVAGLRIILVNF